MVRCCEGSKLRHSTALVNLARECEWVSCLRQHCATQHEQPSLMSLWSAPGRAHTTLKHPSPFNRSLVIFCEGCERATCLRSPLRHTGASAINTLAGSTAGAHSTQKITSMAHRDRWSFLRDSTSWCPVCGSRSVSAAPAHVALAGSRAGTCDPEASVDNQEVAKPPPMSLWQARRRTHATRKHISTFNRSRGGESEWPVCGNDSVTQEHTFHGYGRWSSLQVGVLSAVASPYQQPPCTSLWPTRNRCDGADNSIAEEHEYKYPVTVQSC